MRVKRTDVLKQLEAVTPGLAKKEIIEQSHCFVFLDGRVVTFNDETAVSVKTDLDLTGAVVAEPLLALLRKLDDEELDVEVVDGELLVRGKKKRSGIRMESTVTLPVEGIETPEEWYKLPEGFLQAVGIVQSCVSRDASQFILTCIHIHPDWIEATDTFQIARYCLKTGVQTPLLIRQAALKNVVGVDVTEFSVTENWFHFRNPLGLMLSCRRNTGKYPALSQYLQVEGVKIELPTGIDSVIDKAQIFSAGDDYNLITVELRSGKIKITSQGSDGWYGEVVEAKYAGDEIKFRIVPMLLTEIVRKAKECMISQGKLLVDAGKWVYCTCLSSVE